MNISLRPAVSEDLPFARSLYFETMRWIIERLFGWDQHREEENFGRFFKAEEAQIIQTDGRDVGWVQERTENASIFLCSLYVMPAFQRHGIGGHVLRTLLERARVESKAVTLAVVKINPALRFYERYGFRITHDDNHKFYLRIDPTHDNR